MEQGGSLHCGMFGILLIAEPCKVGRVFCWTRYLYKRSFPLGVYSFLKRSKTWKRFLCS